MLYNTKSGKEKEVDVSEKILPKKIAGKIDKIVSEAIKSDKIELDKEIPCIGSERLLFNLLDSTKGNRDVITLNGSRIGKIESAWTAKESGKPRKDFGKGNFKVSFCDVSERYEIALETCLARW